MVVNDGEFGEVKVTPAEKKEAVQAPKKKVTAKKGPAAAAAKREAKGKLALEANCAIKIDFFANLL